jgi:hypothetical protein
MGERALRDERQLKLYSDFHRSCSVTFLSGRRFPEKIE